MKYFAMLLICIMLLFCTASAAEPIILMYHRLSNTEASDAYTITPRTFEQDIIYLKNKGYKFCTAKEFAEAVKAKNTSDLAVITFDDGYSSDYIYALPILEKYDAKATFYIIGSKINTTGYMTTQQLKQLSLSDKVQLGNHFYEIHDYTRDNLSSMYKTEPHKIKADYDRNIKFIKSITGIMVTTASYPYGVYGNYFDYMIKNEGTVRFCSKEEPPQSSNTPYGRYTRSATTTLNRIEERIKAASKVDLN